MCVTCCSDLHHGPAGHSANDETPGWREKWDSVSGLAPKDPFRANLPPGTIWVSEFKLVLGDANEGWQFTREEIEAAGELIETDVQGNHDFPGSAPDELRVNDTIFLHGQRFDPFVVRRIGRPVAWVVGKLEVLWPDIDVMLPLAWWKSVEWVREKLEARWPWAGGKVQRHFQYGRKGDVERYVEKAAKYARSQGANQIVFGHLHALIDCHRYVDSEWIHVVCVGCCCNGRLDFVEVEV